ncbi:hypothetical protein [Desulfatirhabdium butyrativorans]|uniref:hypothetical protein n=1 Tax=Desulfatirhabdium butyrativorans TaxID=340467 RepID=UPI000415C0D5|nr:hypothetical protein [Desulfatirhabdium butyrativorans]
MTTILISGGSDPAMNIEPIAKPSYFVTQAKAGIQDILKKLDCGFRWGDAEALLQLALDNRYSWKYQKEEMVRRY